MSPQDSNNRGFLSLFNVYTVMLMVAFLAIVTGCVLLSMELGRYKWNIKAKGVAQASVPHGAMVLLDSGSLDKGSLERSATRFA